MNVRIQTYGKPPASLLTIDCISTLLTLQDGLAVDALKKGLVDLQDICDVVADEFWTKRQEFST